MSDSKDPGMELSYRQPDFEALIDEALESNKVHHLLLRYIMTKTKGACNPAMAVEAIRIRLGRGPYPKSE